MTTKIKKAILLSGGIDSTALAYKNRNHCCLTIGFNYGQRHVSEVRYARATAKKLGMEFIEVELFQVKDLFLRCALTDGASDSVVAKNRNEVFLSIACAIAAGKGIPEVLFGATAEDYARFPDCRPAWLDSLNKTHRLAQLKVRVSAPFIHKTKSQVVELARKLGVPFEETMSCYAGNNCGKCLACKTRKAALCGQ
jgi:7-cyano-7-deazaguanine synthase